MADFESRAFQPCKEWIANQIDSHKSWDSIRDLCVAPPEFEEALKLLIDEESWPLRLNKSTWLEFVDYYKGNLITVRNADAEEVVAIDNGGLANHFAIPTGYTSSWEKYKDYLSKKMSSDSIAKKSISMLIHTAAIQNYHFVVYERVRGWLDKNSDVISVCRSIYDIELRSVTKDDLKEANPDYGFLSEINEDYPTFGEIEDEIKGLLSDIRNIALGDENKLEYGEGIHLCVDNCRANKEAEEGTYLRIVYPTDERLKEMPKAPVFIVIGGNTLSRGLTIDGLVCTYFARNSNLADTLMQMARWFGYRRGYELLQRIWMTDSVVEKFEALTKIDMDLKREVGRFMDVGVSPSKFGPRIRNIPEIAKFRITSKKKSQQAEYDDFDFCGDSYETTDFEDGIQLQNNLEVTGKYVDKLLNKNKPRRSDVGKAWVWDGISYTEIKEDFLAHYSISKHSSLYNDLPYFSQWVDSMNEDGKYINWNVAVVDGDNTERPWILSEGISAGQIERTRKKEKDYVDIGSLRSGLDALCDANLAAMTDEQKELFKKVCKERRDIISERSNLNLADSPLLLIYRIKKDGGTPRANSTHRERLNTRCDIIGISIIVPGDSIGESSFLNLSSMSESLFLTCCIL